jgi:cytoskeletal protein CcmA (bactofilin family)
MSLWKDNTVAKPAPATVSPAFDVKEPPRVETPPKAEPMTNFATPAAAPAPRANPSVPGKESVIASDLTIEGKIEGGGSVRIAGKFKGDVNVQGDLTIEAGAKLTGSVRADKVTIAGELEGNVMEASRIDLLQTGVVIGDLKARSLAVAAGATMRGKAEFGGDDGQGPKAGRNNGAGHA